MNAECERLPGKKADLDQMNPPRWGLAYRIALCAGNLVMARRPFSVFADITEHTGWTNG